ncbi:MAG: (Fe-S)-binding protein [Candidatus Latescibacteria bacterium]|nr:(Fe-S)-binding protein [Candidatus Latescibacterota bacterium]
MKVSLMITCLGDLFCPEAGVATVRVLRRLGVEVDFPKGQTCCGQPMFNSGFHRDAREVARHTIEAFEGESPVVAPSGSCAAMVRVGYPELFHDDAGMRGRAEALAGRTFELSEFLVKTLKVEDVGARFEGRVTYHYACHLRGLGMTDEAVRLIRNVKGAAFVPLERWDQCCGFGGSFSVRYPEVSGAIVADKVDCIARTGADAVVSTDAGCLMNIAGAMRRRGVKVRAMHLAELLASE